MRAFRFAFEAREAIGIVEECARRADFDRDIASKLIVMSAVDLTHPTRAKQCLQLICA